MLWPPAISRQHQYDRLLTCGFVHADFGHLFFNMFTFFSFGASMERLFTPRIGALGYALFYAAGIVLSALPSYLRHRNDSNYRSLGASGAVSAVLFAYILIKPWSMILSSCFRCRRSCSRCVYLGYTIYMDRRQTDRINHSAHLWGAVYGIVFTIALEPRVVRRFFDQLDASAVRVPGMIAENVMKIHLRPSPLAMLAQQAIAAPSAADDEREIRGSSRALRCVPHRRRRGDRALEDETYTLTNTKPKSRRAPTISPMRRRAVRYSRVPQPRSDRAALRRCGDRARHHLDKGTSAENRSQLDLQFTDTYVRRGDGWKIAASQATRIEKK